MASIAIFLCIILRLAVMNPIGPSLLQSLDQKSTPNFWRKLALALLVCYPSLVWYGFHAQMEMHSQMAFCLLSGIAGLAALLIGGSLYRKLSDVYFHRYFLGLTVLALGIACLLLIDQHFHFWR